MPTISPVLFSADACSYVSVMSRCGVDTLNALWLCQRARQCDIRRQRGQLRGGRGWTVSDPAGLRRPRLSGVVSSRENPVHVSPSNHKYRSALTPGYQLHRIVGKDTSPTDTIQKRIIMLCIMETSSSLANHIAL